MELTKCYLILLHVTFLSIQSILTLNNTEKFEIVIPEESPITENPPSVQNKTIDKLVQEQTDLIKKIISTHKATTIEYPIVTKKEVPVKDESKLKEEKEQQSIEELRRRCQELFKQFNNSNNTEIIEERSETKENAAQITTVEAFGPQKKPEFLQKRKPEVLQTPKLPLSFSTPSQVEQITQKQALNYFILTRNRTTATNNSYLQHTPNSSEDQKISESNVNQQKSNSIIPQHQNSISQVQNVQHPLHPLIRYVQLEPVILQRMILNNGKMLFYWYRSLPIPQYMPAAKYSLPIQSYPSQVSNIQTYSSQIANTQTHPEQISNTQTYLSQNTNSQKYSSEVLPSIISSQVPQIQVHAEKQSEVSTERVPQYEIEYSTAKKSNDNKQSSDNLYNKQMKFVIPVPYPNDQTQTSTRYLSQFDPYAYYPKSLQPTTVNIPLPYVPSFHMIRTLTIPESMLKANNARIAENSH